MSETKQTLHWHLDLYDENGDVVAEILRPHDPGMGSALFGDHQAFCASVPSILATLRTFAPSDGATLIQAERDRQKSAEGWTAVHDDTHDASELALAAICYASCATSISAGASPDEIRDYHLDHTTGEPQWPWDDKSFKLSADPIRIYEKAGALIAAEIDRLQRLALAQGPSTRP